MGRYIALQELNIISMEEEKVPEEVVPEVQEDDGEVVATEEA